jgi:hypothetical protein
MKRGIHILIVLLAMHLFCPLQGKYKKHKSSRQQSKVVTKKLPPQKPSMPPAVRICWYRRDTYYERNKEKPIDSVPVTTSVIIPCYYKHASLLYALLTVYEQQTRLPDEVVISLSQAHLVDVQIIENIENKQWAFPVKLIMTDEKKYAGENRNIACEHAACSVFICQDADDIPHPQRVEIITHFFNNYPVDHLFHQWVEVLPVDDAVPFVEYNDLENISFAYHQNFHELWNYGHFTNGNVAIARHVFDTVRWSSKPRGQDTVFNEAVYKRFKHGIAIQAVLLGYRRYLSSEGETKIHM